MKKGEYIIPIRQELFPWFFDRNVCNRYLNFLSKQRFNAITFWNFHPFPYFCPIEGHPEVSEISEEERESNANHLRWLIKEAGSRGIRLFWHFYNIYVCPSFAKAHGLSALYNQFTPRRKSSFTTIFATVFVRLRMPFRKLVLSPVREKACPPEKPSVLSLMSWFPRSTRRRIIRR